MQQVDKYDIHWQVFRVKVKCEKDVTLKLSRAWEFFYSKDDICTKLRVLNWMKGLAIAYKDTRRKEVEKAISLFEDITPASSEIIFSNRDFIKYSEKELYLVVKDLRLRNNKWLSHGYRNEDLINFLRLILQHLNDNKLLDELENNITKSKSLPNTHKFLF